MVMMAEEGRSRKQHLFSALSHVLRWERNRAEAQQISLEFLHSENGPSSLLGAFSHSFLCKTKNNTFILRIPTKTP